MLLNFPLGAPCKLPSGHMLVGQVVIMFYALTCTPHLFISQAAKLEGWGRDLFLKESGTAYISFIHSAHTTCM